MHQEVELLTLAPCMDGEILPVRHESHTTYGKLPMGTVEAITRRITRGMATNVIVMAGAGLSVSAGIPDFRSDTGLYATIAKEGIAPQPEDVFSQKFFEEQPEAFFKVCQKIFPGKHRPTLAHAFIKLLDEKGLLTRFYTQNIDGLEHSAGIPKEKIVESHGSFSTGHCTTCSQTYDFAFFESCIPTAAIARCSKDGCDGMVRPGLVFFGEETHLENPRARQLIETDFPSCDLLIVIGTSLSVQPFASLVHMVHPEVPRLLLNRDPIVHPVGYLRVVSGTVFHDEGHLDVPRKDVAMIDEGDSSVRKLAELLGWSTDLEKLHAAISKRHSEERGEATGAEKGDPHSPHKS